MLVGRIRFLFFQNGIDLAPDTDEPVGRGREFMADHFVKLAEIVAGHGGIHVVLDVVVHLPIEKPNHRVECEGAAAEAEVADIVLEADMLGVVAQEEQPTAVALVSEGQHDW